MNDQGQLWSGPHDLPHVPHVPTPQHYSSRHPLPPRCAGATSAALQRSNSGITKKLSGFAAFVAIAIGAVILSGGSISLPFGHAH